MSIQRRANAFQIRVKHPRLVKPYIRTFDDEATAQRVDNKLRDLLDKGIVPAELAPYARAEAANGPDPLVIEIIREYTKKGSITASDDTLLTVILDEIAGLRQSALTVEWVEHYVETLKRESNLAPGTIRKRIGALARVIDWYIRRTTPKGQPRRANSLRGLPTGYSAYTKDDAALLGEGQRVKKDEARDRRLLPAEEKAIRGALNGERAAGKFKRVKQEPAFAIFFELILDTGLRLSEAYRLRVDSLELDKGFMRVEGSKGARGVIKPRTVPLKPHLIPLLQARVAEVEKGLLFPWWDGDLETKKATSAYLSKRFEQLFEYCGVEDFTEHDLRHEATCRWVSLRNSIGWVFSEVEIAKIMGWSSLAMMLRYASLRGEDLAMRLRA